MSCFNLKPMHISDFPKPGVGAKSDYKDPDVLFLICEKDACKTIIRESCTVMCFSERGHVFRPAMLYTFTPARGHLWPQFSEGVKLEV